MSDKRSEKTRAVILEHYARYPKMQITDFFKLLFHSAFGCEHAVSSLDGAVRYVIKESEDIECADDMLVETLDGDYVRVYLSCLKKGVTPEALAEGFCSSARVEPDGAMHLEEKLAVLRELAVNGEIGIPVSSLDEAIAWWKENGYSAVRHSQIYRDAYKPSYRVLSTLNAQRILNGIK